MLTTKSELRKLFLQKRKALGPSEREKLGLDIADGFFRNFDLNRIHVLHCFISIKKLYEINTSIIFRRVWEEYPHVITAVPRVNHSTGELESVTYQRDTKLSSAKWGIPEPVHNEIIEPYSIDLVIVPLVCFDLSGHRVGYGKGFYDRFLVQCRPDCIKVGLTYFPPIDAVDEPGPHDVKLDYCVSPDRLFVLNADYEE